MYSLLGAFGLFILRLISLQRLYCFTRKWKVGPLGQRAIRNVIPPESAFLENKSS